MKIGINIAIAFFLLTGCSKIDRVSKRISGNWELVSYKRTDYEGMISFADAKGSATFSVLPGETDSSSYTFDIVRTFASGTDSLNENGTYKLIEKGNFMYLTEQDSLLQTITYTKYRLLSCTKTDLELEFSKGTNTDILLFKKQ